MPCVESFWHTGGFDAVDRKAAITFICIEIGIVCVYILRFAAKAKQSRDNKENYMYVMLCHTVRGRYVSFFVSNLFCKVCIHLVFSRVRVSVVFCQFCLHSALIVYKLLIIRWLMRVDNVQMFMHFVCTRGTCASVYICTYSGCV